VDCPAKINIGYHAGTKDHLYEDRKQVFQPQSSKELLKLNSGERVRSIIVVVSEKYKEREIQEPASNTLR
jgi:hypothetical protein